MAMNNDSSAELLQAACAAAEHLRTVPAALYAAKALAEKCYEQGDVEPLVYVQMLLQRLGGEIEERQLTIEDALKAVTERSGGLAQ